MDRVQLNSRLISAVGYDLQAGKLTVELSNGKVIRHEGVSEQVYRNLINADSPGSYYRHHIVENGPRPYTRSRHH